MRKSRKAFTKTAVIAALSLSASTGLARQPILNSWTYKEFHDTITGEVTNIAWLHTLHIAAEYNQNYLYTIQVSCSIGSLVAEVSTSDNYFNPGAVPVDWRVDNNPPHVNDKSWVATRIAGHYIFTRKPKTFINEVLHGQQLQFRTVDALNNAINFVVPLTGANGPIQRVLTACND